MKQISIGQDLAEDAEPWMWNHRGSIDSSVGRKLYWQGVLRGANVRILSNLFWTMTWFALFLFNFKGSRGQEDNT
jgi:hypothetical protein